MSLRLRLSLILGGAFLLIWVVAATWMFQDLRRQTLFSLDQRLVASARMVGALVEQLPKPLASEPATAHFSAEQLSIPDGMACEVSSLRGEIIARTHGNTDNNLDSDAVGFHDRLINGEHWRSFTLAQGELRITTADRQQERQSLNHSILLAAALPVLVALLGCMVALWVGIGSGLTPLERLREALRQRRIDSLEPLPLHAMPKELQPLLDTQNLVLQRMGRAIERERRLTDDAAHELRSPLTAIKTHLQVAQMTRGEAQQLALTRAEQGTDRLHHTLEQLLLLARVEGSLSFDDGSQCTVEHVTRFALLDAGQGASQRVELSLAADVAQQPLNMPCALASAVLRNLLDNALRHTPADSAITIRVSRQQHLAQIEVQDTGPGIPSADLARLSERFARSVTSNGSGLGLAIVHAIVQRCGCSLAFDNTDQGLRVTLGLPLQP